MKLIDGLNKRYDITTDSKTEQDFYLNAYQYYDYIFSNLDLTQIYSEGERSYRLKATDIWNDYDKSDLEKCSRQTQLASKMESLDMYCNACALEVRMYRPLKDYYETDEEDMLQDPYAVALVKGIDYAAKVCAKRYPDNDKKGIVKGFNSWFKDERDQYQQELATFHVQFIREVEKLYESDVAVYEHKPALFLDVETGDFEYCGTKGNFPISGQQFSVLKTLQDAVGKPVSYLILIQAIIPSVTEVRSTHKQTLSDVLKNIKTDLGVLPKTSGCNPDPINNIRSYGYRLDL